MRPIYPLAVFATISMIPQKAEATQPAHVWWGINYNTWTCALSPSPNQLASIERDRGDNPKITVTHNPDENRKDEIKFVEISGEDKDRGLWSSTFYTDYHAGNLLVTGKDQCETALHYEKTANGQSDSDNLN